MSGGDAPVEVVSAAYGMDVAGGSWTDRRTDRDGESRDYGQGVLCDGGFRIV